LTISQYLFQAAMFLFDRDAPTRRGNSKRIRRIKDKMRRKTKRKKEEEKKTPNKRERKYRRSTAWKASYLQAGRNLQITTRNSHRGRRACPR
jgi:hypothetical protein